MSACSRHPEHAAHLALVFLSLAVTVACTTNSADPEERFERTRAQEVTTESLRQAYAEAFDGACEEVWSNSPDGNLYYAGTAYTEDECQEEKDETDADGASDVDEAKDRGREAGFDAAFELSPTGVLCYGEQCWTRADF